MTVNMKGDIYESLPLTVLFTDKLEIDKTTLKVIRGAYTLKVECTKGASGIALAEIKDKDVLPYKIQPAVISAKDKLEYKISIVK